MSQLDIQKEKYPLPKFDHSVRASQAALSYGVGAMVDFPDQTLMTAAPEYWDESVKTINDERLAKLLHVRYFGMPAKTKTGTGISYVRFPEWYFCPKCRRFQPLSSWIKEYRAKEKHAILDNDPYMVKHIRCPIDKLDLVVSRIVCVCENGHISDFPWIEWCHAKNSNGPKEICGNPQLYFKSGSGTSEGLESLTVKCGCCGAYATLSGAFDKDVFQKLDGKYNGKYNFGCRGIHPWKHSRENCNLWPIAQQRGSSSIYFPISESSLVIPPYSEKLTVQIENSNGFNVLKNTLTMLMRSSEDIPEATIDMFKTKAINDQAKKIAMEISSPPESVLEVLNRKWGKVESTDNGESTESNKYRAQEYEALRGNVVIPASDLGDFQTESTNIFEYGLPFLNRITLINKIRVVTALTGFSRIKPVEIATGKEKTQKAVNIKQPETDWYPAFEVRGEGIFIEFDTEAINKWLDNNSEANRRAAVLADNYKHSYLGENHPRSITPKFLLLHTIAHLLIKQLSFECGYGISSLRERIYCGEKKDGADMQGIFIYTANGDSEGTLGGLVRQGRSDVFPGIFKKAIANAITCSNDPVCSMSEGQGRESLNLAACHSCTLIPETSCELFNILLDRGVVVGTFDSKDFGFFPGGKIIYNNEQKPVNEKENHNNKPMSKRVMTVLPKTGMKMKDVEYPGIWKSCFGFAENDDLKIFKELFESTLFTENMEKPVKDCKVMFGDPKETYDCDFVWPNAKTVMFSKDNEEAYNLAVESDWKCFFTGTKDFSIEKLSESIKGE